VNKKEVTDLNGRLNVIQKEVTHLLVLLSESLKLHLIKAGDTVKAKDNRACELVNQVQALAAWSLKHQATNKRSIHNARSIKIRGDNFSDNNFDSIEGDSLDEGSIDSARRTIYDPYSNL
jgi:hypothetical protein